MCDGGGWHAITQEHEALQQKLLTLPDRTRRYRKRGEETGEARNCSEGWVTQNWFSPWALICTLVEISKALQLLHGKP